MLPRNHGLNSNSQNLGSSTKFMGVLTLVFCALVFAVPGWSGEGKPHHKHNPEKQLKKLTKQLGLTEEQQVKIKPILEQKAQQLNALHLQMKEVRQHSRAQIESELTPDQVATFKELREKRKERREAHKEKHKKHHKKKHNNGGYEKHDDDHTDD